MNTSTDQLEFAKAKAAASTTSNAREITARCTRVVVVGSRGGAEVEGAGWRQERREIGGEVHESSRALGVQQEREQ